MIPLTVHELLIGLARGAGDLEILLRHVKAHLHRLHLLLHAGLEDLEHRIQLELALLQCDLGLGLCGLDSGIGLGLESLDLGLTLHLGLLKSILLSARLLLELVLQLQLGDLGVFRRGRRRLGLGVVEVEFRRLHVRKQDELLGRVVEVLRLDQIELRNCYGLLLLLHQHEQRLDLLLPGARAEAHVRRHVLTQIPGLGIDLDPLVAQPDSVGLILIFAQDRVEQLEQVLDARLGEDAGDELGLGLSSIERGAHSLGSLVLEHVGIQPLTHLAHAGAELTVAVHVLQHRERERADRVVLDRDDGAGSLHPDEAPNPVAQQILDGVLCAGLLSDLVPVVVGKVDIVQQAPQQRGLDALDVQNQVSKALAEDPVCDDDRRHAGERHLIKSADGGLALEREHLTRLRGHDLVEPSTVVELVVHDDVVLKHLDLLVGPVGGVAGRVFLADRVARHSLSFVAASPSCEALDLRNVVSLLDQILAVWMRDVAAVARVAEVACVAVDQELFRRDGSNLGVALLALADEHVAVERARACRLGSLRERRHLCITTERTTELWRASLQSHRGGSGHRVVRKGRR